jgi:hypothetical protein
MQYLCESKSIWRNWISMHASGSNFLCIDYFSRLIGQDLWKKTHNLFYAKFRSEHKPKFTEDGDSANSSHAELDESYVCLVAATRHYLFLFRIIFLTKKRAFDRFGAAFRHALHMSVAGSTLISCPQFLHLHLLFLEKIKVLRKHRPSEQGTLCLTRRGQHPSPPHTSSLLRPDVLEFYLFGG